MRAGRSLRCGGGLCGRGLFKLRAVVVVVVVPTYFLLSCLSARLLLRTNERTSFCRFVARDCCCCHLLFAELRSFRPSEGDLRRTYLHPPTSVAGLRVATYTGDFSFLRAREREREGEKRNGKRERKKRGRKRTVNHTRIRMSNLLQLYDAVFAPDHQHHQHHQHHHRSGRPPPGEACLHCSREHSPLL